MEHLEPDGGAIIKATITAQNEFLLQVMWPILLPSIKAEARKITRDQDDRKDLIQEAQHMFWQCNPSCFDFRDRRDVAYVRSILFNHMRDVWGRYRGAVTLPEATSVDTATDTRSFGRSAATHVFLPLSHVKALVAQVTER